MNQAPNAAAARAAAPDVAQATASTDVAQAPQAPSARAAHPHPYLAMMGLYLGGFTGMYSETALNVALPQLSGAFGVELSVVQWLVVGYMLAIGIVLPFSGLLLKWFSARSVTVFALAAFFVGALVSGFSASFPVALAGRVIQGVGTGLVLPLMFSMVVEVMPPQKIGAAMGINALVIMSATAIGPTLAGVLVGCLSWRWVFFSFAIVVLGGLVFTVKFQPSPYELTRPRIDALSVASSTLGFGGIVLGVGMSSSFGWASAPVVAALAVGAVALVVYVRRQLSMEAPVIDLRVFSIDGFRVAALAVTLNFSITLSAMYILPQFYQNAMLIAVSVTGLVMLPGGVVNAIVSMLAGRVYDRVGAKGPAIVGFAISIVACVMLLFTTPDSPLGYVVACHIVLVVGVPLAMSPCQTHALASLPRELSRDGSTMLNTLQQVAGAIATAVATYLVTTGTQISEAGGTDAVSSFTQGAHWGIVFSLVLAVAALCLALRLKARPREEEPVVIDTREEERASSGAGATRTAGAASVASAAGSASAASVAGTMGSIGAASAAGSMSSVGATAVMNSAGAAREGKCAGVRA